MSLRDESAELIQELVKNRCVNPPGNEMKSIKSVNRYLESYGVETEIFESDTNRGNLLCTIEGTGEGPSLMFGPAHVDVVPVEDTSKWEVPPFSGKIKDDCIWGRGTLDMLYIVATQAVVFAHLCDGGFQLKGDLKFLVVSDEEAAGQYGAGYMVKNHTDKVKVDYLITETGGHPIAQDRFVYAYGEKGATWLRLKFEGEEQHGSMPFKSENAVVKMADAIRRLRDYQPPLTTEYINVLVENMPVGSTQKWLLRRKTLLPRLIEMISKDNLAQAKILHALSRMTLSPDLCEGGTKVNVVAGKAHVDVDIRTLPGQDAEYVREHLRNALGPLAAETDIGPLPKEAGSEPSYGNASDVQSPLVKQMGQSMKELKGDNSKLVPMLMPGVTDCRFFRNRFGTQAYGFSLFDDTLEMGQLLGLIHGTNERVPLGSVELTAQAYMHVARGFLS
ncbi:MAG: M20/M25/M40 family metallo-hydrolase [Candidatus Thorarchaeota archaeon]